MRRRAPLLAVVAAILLALLAWTFLITPEREERTLLLEETEGIRSRQQQQRIEIARLEEIRDNELEVRAAIARLEQYIPSGAAQPSVIRQVQLAADAAGVDIVGLTFSEPQLAPDAPSPREPGSVVAQIPVVLVVEGGYFQGTDFLRRIETELPRAVMVDSVGVVEAPEPRGFPVLLYTLNARIFAVVPASAVPGAQGAPAAGATPAPDATPTPGAAPVPAATASPAPAPEPAA